MSDLELTMMRRVGELNKELANLKTEADRLKAEVERLTAFTTRTIIPNEELQAQVERLTLENSQYEEHHKYGQNVITSLREEVERLTEAGDAMAEDLKACYRAEGYDPADSETIPNWNAAKEGKQP
jgi:predicted nuclease with TOPRIM domain